MGMCGCAYWKSEVNSLKGSITGNTYECQFFSNQGERFMTAEGTNIDINNNIVYEKVYTDEPISNKSKKLISKKAKKTKKAVEVCVEMRAFTGMRIGKFKATKTKTRFSKISPY